MKSPQLLHLELDSGQFWGDDRVPTLHDLFGKVSPGTALRLKHLSLSWWRWRLDSITLPHLKCLTSLELNSPVIFRGGEDDYSHDVSEIWHTFRIEGIHLSDLGTSAMDEELLQYLGSYSGLRRLKLTSATGRTEKLSNNLADQFYKSVLPRHSQSLTNIEIYPGHQGRWCFGFHNASIISQCQQVKNLLMAVSWAADDGKDTVVSCH